MKYSTGYNNNEFGFFILDWFFNGSLAKIDLTSCDYGV